MLESGTQTPEPPVVEDDMRGCRERCSALLGVAFGAIIMYVIIKYRLI